MKVIKRTPAALLNLVILFSLTLALAAPGLSQGPGGDDGVRPTTAAPQAAGSNEGRVAPVSTPEPIDCNKPLPGKRTTLAVDDEILVAYAGQSNNTHLAKYDNTSNTDASLKYFWSWDTDGGDLYQPRSVAITTADLDLDGKDEVISAVASGYTNELGVVSIKNPEASSGIAYDLWTSSSNYREGDNMGWIMAAGAGDLDGALGGDEAEEVVLAFEDDQKYLQVVLLDGEDDGGIKYMGDWRSSSNYRYDMHDISVDVGDLDGDGYDDEIVLALSDGGRGLQVIVLEYNGSGGLTELAYGRPDSTSSVDVTTGVFSGDGKDQISVAYKDGTGWLNVRLLEYDSVAKSIPTVSWWRNSDNFRGNVDYVSVASGDIDGDRWDEVVTAFADTNDQFQAVTLDAITDTLKFHGSQWGLTSAVDVSYVSVDAGDIDGDGRAEVVASFSDYDGLLQMLSFDENSACPCADDGGGLHLRDMRQDWHARSTFLAMGDVDGNNVYADYTGKCEETHETRLISMVNRPPYWEAYNPTTQVAYASTIKGGDVTEDHITNTYGSSVTFGEGFDFGSFKLGTSFTREWNHSITHSSAHGSSLETRDGWNSDDDGLVPLNTVSYYTYQYKKRDGTGLARVSVPVATLTDAKRMSFWNESGGAQDLFPDSWVPGYRTGWKDTQSTSLPSYFTYLDRIWGEGADTYDFNGNGTPDYLFAVMAGTWSGGNNVFYRIGFDMSSDGIPQDYSLWIPIWNSVGNISAGLGVALTELNGNDTPELVVAWTVGNDYYRVMWDLAADGKFSSMGDWKEIPGDIGSNVRGAGLDIYDLNGNGRPEMFFGWIDNPGGANHGYYRVGWDLDANGDSSNWWLDPKPVEGAFGSSSGGMGLTVTDADGDGHLDLVAAWGREREEQGFWAVGYSIGRNLQGSAYVDSWVPGHPIPAPRIPTHLEPKIFGVAVASADLVAESRHPELVVGWNHFEPVHPPGFAYSRVGTCQQLGGQVDQRPTDIEDPVAKDGQFKIKLYDEWWVTNGDLLWRWDKMPGPPPPLYVSKGGGDPYFKVEKDTFTSQTVATSESYNYAVGGEAEFLGIGAKGSKTWGFEKGSSYTISWEKGFFMDGMSHGLPDDAPLDKQYMYDPFTYMQEVKSSTGIKQAYMVLDYFVPCRGSDCGEISAAKAMHASSPLVTPGQLGIAPSMPIVNSPTHPDPGTWYAADTATFTWRQPDGDPAVVDSYRWYVDRSPDTVPSGASFGLTNTTTYEGLSDGLWYVHLRARDEGGEWSEAAHRAVRVDTHPPEVEIALDPPYPTEGGDWYNVPVTADVSATDGADFGKSGGSGLASIETSTDGITWQPYTSPLLFDADTRSTTLWARATDLLGLVSQPVSTTFRLDLTLPISVEEPGCWLPGGGCEAGVITDAAGNQRLRLRGQIDGSLSGERGVGIQINGERWTAADEVGEGWWSYTSGSELGAGCHTFDIQSDDWAGNEEPLHAFDAEVIWHPRERPDLSRSSLSVVPGRVRPGDTVDVALSVPNSGWQETWVPISVTLPSGLHVLLDSISSDGSYDAASRTITWPARYLWPGRERNLSFSAQVDAGLGATSLVVAATALGTWPIVDTCPADALPGFHDRETTVERTATLAVDPTLPDGADTRPPASPFLRIEAGSATNNRQVQLRINAGPDAAASAGAVWMYVREWTLSATTGAWAVAQESGWLPYRPSYPWNLSQGDGVKYLGVWLADGAGNVSVLDRSSLTFTNLLESRQSLPDGQRIQYRFWLRPRELAVFNLVSRAGNADLYVWQPRNGWRPDYAANGTGTVDVVGFWAAEGGVYLVEAKAEGDAVYQLLLAGDVAPRAPTQVDANTPDHPLTVSDPLSAGAGVAPAPPDFRSKYLPIIMRNR